MIAVDTNVLIYAHRQEDPRHQAAYESVRKLAEGDVAWGVPVFVIGEFVRVVTNPKVASPVSTTAQALSLLDGVLASPSVRLLLPGARFWPILRELIPAVRGSLVFDAQIAAVCLEHGASIIVTEDRDFHRFPGLSIRGLEPGW